MTPSKLLLRYSLSYSSIPFRPPPFSLLTKSHTQILPRYPALLNSTGPIFSVFQAQFDALPKTLSLHTCPKNSQILTGYSCTQFRLSFCPSFDRKKKEVKISPLFHTETRSILRSVGLRNFFQEYVIKHFLHVLHPQHTIK